MTKRNGLRTLLLLLLCLLLCLLLMPATALAQAAQTAWAGTPGLDETAPPPAEGAGMATALPANWNAQTPIAYMNGLAVPDEAAETAAETADDPAGVGAGEDVPRWMVDWMQQQSTMTWLICVAVVLVFGVLGFAFLYKSASPATQQLILSGAANVTAGVDQEAKRRQQIALLNDIDWDDPLWAGIVAGTAGLRRLTERLAGSEAQARAAAKYGTPAQFVSPPDDARG